MFENCIENVREKSPLIHCITNYVTVNDVANILLAIGGSPIMADDPEEAAEITTISNGLTINIGNLDQRTITAMHLAGKQAKKLGHPVLLDPVGAGASKLRTDNAIRILDEVKPDIVRGNISEIKTLVNGSGTTQGVDADDADTVTDENIERTVAYIKNFAERTGSIIAITGAIDLIADGKKCYAVRNGNPAMSRITGTGCMLSGLTTALLAGNLENKLEAAACAVTIMGVCGEIAMEHLLPYEGNASYRNRIIDAVYHIDSETLNRYARVAIL